METLLYPPRETWISLCKRPVSRTQDIDDRVREIMRKVRDQGDKALKDFALQFDKIAVDRLKVNNQEFEESEKLVPAELKKAIGKAIRNIGVFHRQQSNEQNVTETMSGVKCWRKNVAIEKVGLYVPGGSAPLFSTVLMLAVPAKIAGCREIILCTPPGINGSINPAILFAALKTGVTEVFKVGGAQAIAAMAYGTESIPKVFKIFGPGNQYVTRAKEIALSEGTAIDIPAGPSEVLVIGDFNASPEFIASDLLSQAEHGPDSQVIFLTDSEKLLRDVISETEMQLNRLPRKIIAAQSLKNSRAILLGSLDECLEFSNLYAPEHLILNTKNPRSLARKVVNAGSVFIGKYSCESSGDYASGPNHTLPTNGHAVAWSGVSTDSFVRKITFQEISEEGLLNIGISVEIMAEAEKLMGHKNAVSLRLNKIRNA